MKNEMEIVRVSKHTDEDACCKCNNSKYLCQKWNFPESNKSISSNGEDCNQIWNLVRRFGMAMTMTVTMMKDTRYK